MGLAAVALVLLSGAPPPGALALALEAPALGRMLPAGSLSSMVRHLTVLPHEEDEWPMALYVPPERELSEASASFVQEALPGLLTWRQASSQGPRQRVRSPAPLWRPVVFLHAPTYLRKGRIRSLHLLAVDEAASLYLAVVQALLDRSLLEGEAWRAELRKRAETGYGRVPEDQQLEVFLEAWADFGAHCLTVATQVLRSAGRARDGGKGLCGALGQRVGLFALWPRMFTDMVYPVFYIVPQGGGVRRARGALSVDDRQRMVGTLLGQSWTGDPDRDFAWLCAAGDQGVDDP